MRLGNPNQPLFVSYRGRGDRSLAAPGPLWPLLSTVPGLFCWMLFASAAMPRELPLLERLGGLVGQSGTSTIVLVTWALSATVSLVTLLYYARRLQTWYTTLCMAIHLAGLLFSFLLLGGLAVLLVAA